MQKSGFTGLINEYVRKGMVYVGSSAGSVVAGPDVTVIADLDDRQRAPELKDAHGLNLTDLTIFPHWGTAHFQKKYEATMKNCYRQGFKIILLNDNQYVFVHDGTYEIVAV
jgi:dipeptidase E